jgi:uncharacterized protein YqfA (UPF0365 family)
MLIAQIEIVVFGAVIVFFVGLLLFFAQNFELWFQAYMSRVPLSVFAIIGMRFRKIDVKAVVRSLIMAQQAGIPLSIDEVERAYLQGADLERITHAWIEAHREQKSVSFQELVEADLDQQQAGGDPGVENEV